MADEEKMQDIIEAAEDALFQKIIDRQEGAQGLEEQKHPGPTPTQAELTRWERALDQLGTGKTPPMAHGRKRLGRTALLAILAAAFLLVAASALYRPILNWVESVHERYTQLQAGETVESEMAQWVGVYVPKNPPAGFTLSDAENLGDVKYMEYANLDSGRITFYQYGPHASVRIDTEKADKTITTWANGQIAYLFQKDALSTLYWSDSDCVLSVEYDTASVSESVIQAFAEGIQWRP